MGKIACPVLKDHLASNQCMENLAGLASYIYVFDKNDLVAPLSWADDEEAVYKTPEFKAGKGLYKLVAKDAAQKIASSSLGFRKGFSQTFDFVIDEVSKAMGVNARALNNLDLGFIIQDGDEWQIIYSPQYKGKFDNDGIKTDTGAAANDERQTSCTYKLEPVTFPNCYVKAPEGGFDSLLASAAA